MAKVIISKPLFRTIEKTFSRYEAHKIIDKLESLEDNPHKGKTLSNIGGVVVKEIKYKQFKFYFLTDGNILKFGTEDELAQLLIKFVRMSEKKDQQKQIKSIKDVLLSMGFKGFN